MTRDDADWLLVDEDVPAAPAASWKILIVDDEPEVHSITRLALRDVQYRERSLTMLSAHSGVEARDVLKQHDDIALVLLDVVMETDDAGLQLARWIREQLRNEQVRIVLRTGEAGQAPERRVVLEYDINDYKEKSELTSQKLITTVISSLRAYQAIAEVATLNRELEQKVAARTAELERSATTLKRSLDALEQGERAARRVQYKLLPAKTRAFNGYRFSHQLLPSEIMSGDFVDYLAIDAQRVLFYIADVSGHGVASAFVTVYLKRFVSSAYEAFATGRSNAIEDPAQLLAQLNQELMREQIGKHIALFMGVLDTSNGTLLYANAGAFPNPLLVSADEARFIEQRSTPVGLLERATFANDTLTLPPRFRLLLASDGVMELLPEPTTKQKLETLRTTFGLGFDDAEAVAAHFGWSPAQHPPDDVTLLVLACEGAA